MNELNAFGIGQYLARRFGITDTPVPAPSMAPEIFPVVDAKPAMAEDHFLRGERLCGCGGSNSAVALEYGVISLVNPTGSGLIVTIEQVYIQNGTSGSYHRHYLEGATLLSATPSAASTRDSRWGYGATRTAAQFRAFTTATAYNPAWPILDISRWAGGYPPNLYWRPIVLAPGGMYIIYTTAVNEVLAASMIWRERPAYPSELG